jgi:hypothetical protein
MKIKSIVITCITLQVALTSNLQAQLKAGPYVVKNSDEFESPKKHVVSDPIPYGKDGIVQVNRRGLKSISFQKFSNDLKYESEKTIDLEGKFNDRVNYQSFIKLKNKTYLFAREVFKEEEKEGITALEFSYKNLDFVGSAKNLFKSSDKVQGARFKVGFAPYGVPVYGTPADMGGYDLKISEDDTKFLYTYSLVNKERDDKINKEVIGMQVFDENLVKLWGDDFEMPYTEAKMDNIGFILSDDGAVYLMAKVYEGDTPKEGKDKKKPNYHFEILVYKKGAKTPKIIKIKLDNYFPTEAWVYENTNHEIAITGFYSKALNKPVDGAYMVKLDVETGTFTKIKGGYYEIPSDVIKAFTSEREKRKMEKQEDKDEDGDIGISNLEINEIYVMDDGTTKIVAEQYHVRVTYYYDSNCHCMKQKYDTFADDIFVMSISNDGKLEWTKKIPKSQHANGAYGPGISINTMKKGNDIHIFYIDNIKNLNLPIDQAPKRHEDRRGGFLTGVSVSTKGDIKKYSLGEIETYDTNFYIREFVDGERNNLISTERRKKQNILFSVEVN